MNFKENAQKIHKDIIANRRSFHQEPELSFKEFKTQEKIIRFLTEQGIEILPIHSDTSVVGIVRGGKKGKTFALRGDMDALPVLEQNDYSFKSQNDGVMHACGHDAHTSMLMGAAVLLNDARENLHGDVKLLFQAGEEQGPGGASGLIDAGAMENVEGIMAFHVNSKVPVGCLSVLPGGFFAAPDGFELTVRGVGGHGAHPENCIDPIVITAQIIGNLQTILSRNLSGPQAAVLTVGTIHGGTKSNIIADEVTITGTVRTFDPKVQDLIEKRIKEIVKGAEIAYNCTCTLNYTHGCPALINDGQFINNHLMPSCSKIIGREQILAADEPSMVGEDYARYLQLVPGAMAYLGSGNLEKGIDCELHSASFQLDEDCLWVGAACLAQVAWDFLAEK